MGAHADKAQENKKRSASHQEVRESSKGGGAFQLADNRPLAIQMRQLQADARESRGAMQLRDFRETANSGPLAARSAQPGPASAHQGIFNSTGLPDKLKSGIEALSGLAMDDVKVHRNSAKPAQLHAHAYAKGTEIHLAAGKEQHLPHEAWHIVQQKQGRVSATNSSRGVAVNNDPGLEHEADVMGEKANVLPRQSIPFQLAVSAPATHLFQLIAVDLGDIGKTYEIRVSGSSSTTQGVLAGIPGGGWYRFNVGGNQVNVRGQDNILREVSPTVTPVPSSIPSNNVNSTSSSSPVSVSTPLATILGQYNVNALSTTVSEFAVNDVAKTYNVSPQQALQMIADSFGRNPRTIRIHYPFGSKTIAKGNKAYSDPSKQGMLPQAMVSYRKGDYGKHKKVGKDYDDWADELSDDEDSETEKMELARQMHEYLTTTSSSHTFKNLSSSKRAALGGILTATQISDRLRTYKDSDVTPMDFSDQIEERGTGSTTMHDIFGDKSSSTFLPARSSGSGLQREQLSVYIREIQATAQLGQNNCLINAIAQAALNRLPTMEELVIIRSNLGNVGQMLVPSPNTINEIRRALHVPNPITIRNPLGSGAMNEAVGGAGHLINIYHTGNHHFQTVPSPSAHYDMS